MTDRLPQGPRMPVLLQTLGTWSRPTAFLERCRARYGARFTIRLLGQPPLVMISDPEEIKQIFLAPPEVLHPGEGARILEPIVGSHSVILLDEGPHLEQRKLMLPAFHGERMQRLSGLIGELTAGEVDSWPLDTPLELHPRLQRLTLEIILRAVFGLERGSRLDSLRELLTRILALSESPLSLLPPPPRLISRFTPMVRFEAMKAQVDELIYGLIEERRDEPSEGEDVLAMLLAATHEDGSPMSAQELRDELMTALVAGHETTASQLSWAFERIAREPRVQERLRAELDSASGDDYMTATINEILRRRPVLPNAEPRLVKEPVEIGGWRYPRGAALLANAYLLHHDPAIYPDPYAFRPERFLENPPGTYTWIPFGGGRRRCLGASFALLEMKIALRTVLDRYSLTPAHPRPERTRRRSITISPADGGRVLLHARSPGPAGADAAAERVASPA
ncbi:MAG: cytochrome P450 [Solirubrobacterales bacterium]|nr:cytochrome P450 [Solirubrobacterales bacterium]